MVETDLEEDRMQYMLLIYQPAEAPADAAGPEAWMQYTATIQQDGSMQAGDALADVEEATTVRRRDGQTLTTDGPFADTKEWLAGYYVIDVPDLDAAIERASRVPNVGYGSIEIRPVRGM
jgi:hypothetical protein